MISSCDKVALVSLSTIVKTVIVYYFCQRQGSESRGFRGSRGSEGWERRNPPGNAATKQGDHTAGGKVRQRRIRYACGVG